MLYHQLPIFRSQDTATSFALGILVGAALVFLEMLVFPHRASAAPRPRPPVPATATPSPSPTATPTPAPTQPPVAQAEAIVLQASRWCPPQGCLGLTAWEGDGLVPDSRLRAGMAVAYQTMPEWRPLARDSAQRSVRILVGDVPPGAAGVYIPWQRLIRIAPTQLGNSPADLAPLLTHEVAHSVSTTAGIPGAACVTEEAGAFAWTAATAAKLDLARWGPVISAWRAGTLEQYVTQSPMYQAQCFGRRSAGVLLVERRPW